MCESYPRLVYMKHFHPLVETHPEFSVLIDDTSREYRLENWRLSPNDDGKVIHNTSCVTRRDALLLVVIFGLWSQFGGILVRSAIVGVSALCFWFKCTQVLRESVIVIPPHGIQLETSKGLPPLAFFTTRRFIPTGALCDVVINEALRRWNVRFYLVAIQSNGPGNFKLNVAFENLLPPIEILKHIYLDINNSLAY